MIKNNKIKIPITVRNKTHYQLLGYNPIIGEELEIETNHLPKSSHVRIDVICNICESIQNIMYDKYYRNILRYNFYSCKKCSRQKAALTSIEKYGTDNYSKTDECRKKVEETNMRKYGQKTNLLNPKFKEEIKNILKDKYGTENFWEINRYGKKTNKKLILIDINKINKTYLVPSEDLYIDFFKIDDDTYYNYRTLCRNTTNKNIKKLIENWNGLDYYDNEDISNNFNLNFNDPSYPTIDHKTSIYYGYLNKISPDEIGSIDNICFTKRGLNSKKCSMCEEEFLIKLKNHMI